MSLLKNLKTDETIAGDRDSVGGGGVLESGLYPAKVALAYITKAKSEALALVLQLKTSTGKDIKQTLWMTGGKDKGCANFYIDKDGQKQYLPGFVHANNLALLTVGREISELDTETKVVNVYSFDAKAEVPTKVEMVMDLIGQEILVGLLKQTVDKTTKNEATGAYVPTGETRDENEIDKFFRMRDSMTVAEIRAKAEEAVFVGTWAAKWKGVTKNKAKGAASGGAAGAPRAAAPAATKKPANSLFA